MSLSDKNKPERVWNDPPVPGESVTQSAITVGANVSPELRQLIAAMSKTNRKLVAFLPVITAMTFTVCYAICIIAYPEITQLETVQLFIFVTIGLTITNTIKYYK